MDAVEAWLENVAGERFARQLLRWYDRHQRELPWRSEPTPYRVWISEIMLQQTRVEVVREYFRRFLDRFPDPSALARAPEEDVLRLWEGLGYYRRARNLHAAARQIVALHGGELPADPDALRRLPGIGRYTAGAILSIAFGQKQPILEGNTLRLHARLTGCRQPIDSASTQKRLWHLATEILPDRRPGDFNQALMDLGSGICRPQQPLCPRCPVREHCLSFRDNLVELIPVRENRMQLEDRDEATVMVLRGNRILMRKCGPEEWWTGLWDFPRTEVSCIRKRPLQFRTAGEGMDLAEWLKARTGLNAVLVPQTTVFRHSVTRYRIRLHLFRADSVSGRLRAGGDWVWQPLSKLPELPLSASGRLVANDWKEP